MQMPKPCWLGGCQARTVAVGALVLLVAAPLAAQTFETVGTRSAGMGGAFVAVADDASAVYWNPAGLALGGSYFSLVLDGKRAEAAPEDSSRAGRHSATLIALSTLPVGLSYYRLSASRVSSANTLSSSEPGGLAQDVEQLTTHHAGVTLVQSVIPTLAVATTLKAVRGVAASDVFIGGRPADLLEAADNLPSRGSTRFDADLGVLASFGSVRAGLTVRNVTEPDFPTPSGQDIELKRQTRAGIAYLGVPGVTFAADVDLERGWGSRGEVRNFAAGAEARLAARATVRSGVHLNTLPDQPDGRAAVVAFGGTVTTFRSLLVDGQVTIGAKTGDRGWGIAARLVY
jgi:hypothetical protein